MNTDLLLYMKNEWYQAADKKAQQNIQRYVSE
jgi:hypothetical protein